MLQFLFLSFRSLMQKKKKNRKNVVNLRSQIANLEIPESDNPESPRESKKLLDLHAKCKNSGIPDTPSYVRRHPRRYLASHDQHIGRKLHSIRTLLELPNYADGLLTSFPARFPHDSFPVKLTNRRERRKAGVDKAPMSIAGEGRGDERSQPPPWIRKYELFGKHEF